MAPDLPDSLDRLSHSDLIAAMRDLLGAFAQLQSKHEELTGAFAKLRIEHQAVKDELARIKGVGDVFLFGQRDYSMRIWVDPAKLASRGLSAGDVVKAVREQRAVADGHDVKLIAEVSADLGKDAARRLGRASRERGAKKVAP